MFATNHLAQPLVDVLRWCLPRLNVAEPSTCFRSQELAPKGHLITDCNSDDEVAEIVNEIVLRRSRLLQARGQFAAEDSRLLGRDRLFAFRPLDSLFHGTSPPESDGYIDDWEIAPWDTWFGSWDGYVVTWVAQPFIELVDAAIAANAEDCIRWIDEWRDPGLIRRCQPFIDWMKNA